MTREQYSRITSAVRESQLLSKVIPRANQILTGIVFLIYPVILTDLFLYRRAYLFRTVLIPLLGFILCTVMRKIINRPRPYEFFGLPSVIPKDTHGKSFPSRHVFSAAIIATTIMSLPGMMGIGILLLVASLGLAGIRVVTGVHYPADVIVGFIMGCGIGAIGFFFR